MTSSLARSVATFGAVALGCSSQATPPAAQSTSTDSGVAVAEESRDAATPVARACYLDEAAAKKAPTGGFRAPRGKYLGKCDKATIDNLLMCTHQSDADAPNDPHCKALVPEKACMACIFSDRGAILDVKFPNVAGCVALALGDDACGDAYHDWVRCHQAGCASCLDDKTPVPDADQQRCGDDASRTVCNERADFGRCDALAQRPDVSALCEPPRSIDDGYLGRLYNFFCGTEGAF